MVTDFMNKIDGTSLNGAGESDSIATSVSDLHDQCGIYTSPEIVSAILTKIGWDRTYDLRKKRFLEPCFGDGIFLKSVVVELIRSFKQHGRPLHFRYLSGRIIAFEIHPVEAEKARASITTLLCTLKLGATLAARLASEWIRTQDFLLSRTAIRGITHIGTNPPYIRWCRIPSKIGNTYRAILPKEITRGDLCVAFLARIIDVASKGAYIGVLSSDRWLYSAYAESFRNEWLRKVEIIDLISVSPSSAFQRNVSTSPIICILKRKMSETKESGDSIKKTVYSHTRQHDNAWSSPKMKIYCQSGHLEVVRKWRRMYPPIEHAGCRIKVGPALGHEPAYIGPRKELEIEKELLVPYVTAKEIKNGVIRWSERWAICMGASDGGFVDLSKYPLAEAHLEKFKEILIKRTCVRHQEFWYRTIDRTIPSDWSDEKILVREISRSPCAVYDSVGYMPSHGIYAIFSHEWPVEVLSNLLSTGILKIVMETIAPRMPNGDLRCYKRFLSQIPLPLWRSLSNSDRTALYNYSKQSDNSGLISKVSQIYDVMPELLSG